MSRKKSKQTSAATPNQMAARQKFLRGEDDFDPGARLCGHGDRAKRAHYLGGGLWVCFECFAKLLLGSRYTAPSKGVRP
jgi:hypothetical protein